MGTRKARLAALLVATSMALAVTACADAPAAAPGASPAGPAAATLNAPGAVTTVLGTDDPAALAVATSRALFVSSPVAVLAGPTDLAAAAPEARRLGAPLLPAPLLPAPVAAAAGPAAAPGSTPASGSAVSPGSASASAPTPPAAGAPAAPAADPAGSTADPAGVGAELARLGVRAVLTVGEPAAHWAAAVGLPSPVTDAAALPRTTPPPARSTFLVLATDPAAQAAAVATAQAGGARVEALPGGDPRAVAGARAALTPFPERVIGLGRAFGSADALSSRLAVAASGATLPGGGQLLFPGRRMVALYGHPGAPALGVLGEQDLAASVTRAQQLAAQYQPLVKEPVVPAFEIIATVADGAAGADGDYSAESDPKTLLPWVDAAEKAGIYVVLDLQPGRADFLSQAKLYTDLLRRPNVGLALDPEWRLGPNQVHRVQIGTVGVDEINRVATWLADLTRDAKLPQKLLMLHQFRLTMISDRQRLDTSRDELSVVIHSDGFGTPGEKMSTWNALHGGAPAVRWGWKNFIDEDKPTFTPAQTVPIGPTPPVFVSYQ